MHILINAITISPGGGLVVLENMLKYCCGLNTDNQWFVAAKNNLIHRLPNSSNITYIPVAEKISLTKMLWWYELTLPKLIKKYNIDLLFSHTNILPAKKLRCKSLLLVHNAGFFCKVFENLQQQFMPSRKHQLLWKFKKFLIYNSIKRADGVTVQTKALGEKIVKYLPGSHTKIVIIPHGPGQAHTQSEDYRTFPTRKVWKLGYITLFGVQKNFETVFKAIYLLKQRVPKFKFIITLNENYPEFKIILNLIKRFDLEDTIINYGEIHDPDKINKIYQQLDLFIFPSLCESFGFTLIEALAHGLPIIAADTQSNEELLGENGNFVAQTDADQLARALYTHITNKEIYQQSSRDSVARSKEFCWQRTAIATLDLINRTVPRC